MKNGQHMIKDYLFELYEKLYFHEIDIREKFNARLQLPLAILVAIISFLGFLLQNANKTELSGFFLFLFWSGYVLSCIATTLAIYFFIKSWYGYTYQFIPSANSTEEYHTELIELYSDFEDKEELISKGINDYLYKYYAECSSVNTENNDKKAISLHKAMTSIICAVVLSFLAFIPYQLSNFKTNNNSTKKYTKGIEMTEKKQSPPPPPAPPPKREIQEGVKIVTPSKKENPNKGNK